MPPSKILIVDDNPDNIFLLEVILHAQGFSTISASNGAEAVEAVKSEEIDLILMDVMMPVMDGFEASKQIRSMKLSEHIPIILVTAKKRDVGDVLRGLGEGALEYLTKPYDDNELVARVRSMLRIKHLHDNNLDLLKKLQIQQKQTEMELVMAESVQRQMLPSKEFLKTFSELNIESYYLASTWIGGDIFDVTRYGENKIAFMLADVTGHGPSAALIMALLKALVSSEGWDKPKPTVLMQRLNAKLLEMIPESHFVTMFFGIADFKSKELCYVTAGHPPPYLLRKIDKSFIKMQSTGSMLGMFENEHLEFRSETFPFESGDKLVVFSDGVYEASNGKGELYGLDRLEKFLKSQTEASAQKVVEGMVAEIESFWDPNTDLDDIAVVVAEFI